MRVRLTRRLAECINGVDLSRCRVGDLIDLSQPDAEMLIAEGWATPVASESKDALYREPRAAAANGATHRRQRHRP
jgi:hypothetical protein